MAEVGVVIDVTKGPGNVSQRRLLTMQEVSENEPNFYNLTFEAVIDNADADVEIKVTVRNSQGEEDSAVLTFDRDPYADR